MTNTTNYEKPDAVVLDGPFADVDRYGDEIPYWSVTLASEENECIKTYSVYSWSRAVALAEKIARDRRIEFVRDGSPN